MRTSACICLTYKSRAALYLVRHDVCVELAVFSHLFVQAIAVQRCRLAGVPGEKNNNKLRNKAYNKTLTIYTKCNPTRLLARTS